MGSQSVCPSHTAPQGILIKNCVLRPRCPLWLAAVTECHHTLMPGKELVQTKQQEDSQGFAFCLSAGSMR